MANEKKRGIKDKIGHFRGCEEWRVPTKETEKLGEVLSQNTAGKVRLMLRAGGAISQRCPLGVRSMTQPDRMWNKWTPRKGEQASPKETK